MADLAKAAARLAAAFSGRVVDFTSGLADWVDHRRRRRACWVCGNDARGVDAQGQWVCPLHEEVA